MNAVLPPPAMRLFARASVAGAFVLLTAGGLVTSTGSSLAVPDWPLAYGQVLPPMKGGVLFEQGHRLIAAAVGLMTWALAGWVLLRERRRWVRNTAAAAAFGILLQALLGGITVLYDLPPKVSIAHACLGQTVFCLLVALAEASSAAPRPWEGARPLAGALWLAAGLVYIQLFLGAVLRHTGGGILWHLLGAAAASAAIFRACHLALTGEPGREGPALALGALVALQLLLGVSAWVARPMRLAGGGPWPVVFTTAHVLCGALILALTFAWALRSSRAAA